jgi:hypothetical protein
MPESRPPFLASKWARELDYALRESLWCADGNRIAVRFQYESHDAAGQWYRSYGNELWEFDENGLMRRREASINDDPIDEGQRWIFGPRPGGRRGRPHDRTATTGRDPRAVELPHQLLQVQAEPLQGGLVARAYLRVRKPGGRPDDRSTGVRLVRLTVR